MANLPDLWREFDRPLASFGTWRPLLRQLDDLMNEAFEGSRMLDDRRSFVPSVDVDETDDHYVLSFDMPGLEKENIDIEVQGNQLLISGERKQESDGGEGRSRFVERRYGKFQRTLTLPDGINSDQVEAQYRNGVLTVAVQKAPESKRQKIKIGDSKSSGFFNKLLGSSSKKEKGKEPISVKTTPTDRSEGATTH